MRLSATKTPLVSLATPRGNTTRTSCSQTPKGESAAIEFDARDRAAPGYDHGVKRAVLRLVVFLLSGAAASIVVANACSLWSPIREGDLPRQSRGFGWGRDLSGEAQAFTRIDAGFGYAEHVDMLIGLTIADLPWDATREAGWPCACVIALPYDEGSPNIHVGLPVPRDWKWLGARPGRRIMLEPRWLGLVIDSGMYALLFSVCLFGVRRQRVRRRAKRRSCVTCAYPVGTSPVCTECGAPVKPKHAETAA